MLVYFSGVRKAPAFYDRHSQRILLAIYIPPISSLRTRNWSTIEFTPSILGLHLQIPEVATLSQTVAYNPSLDILLEFTLNTRKRISNSKALVELPHA